ncbi:hypothetical protein QE152_g32532 [Popillia japonica]|uniref:Reverse transcriptase domain-containing protein n=1 Tax=Popillia japonica TaxID=7064 RepID=A0AAW1IZ60_POPJA
MAQEIPVMIGQTFLNNSKVVMLVFDGNVRLLCMDHDIGKSLNLATVKIPLWAKNSTVIAANTTALVAVSSRGKFTGDLYVRGGLRPVPGNEYAVNECVTKGQDGYVSNTNLTPRDLEVSDNHILARCIVCFEDICPRLHLPVLTVTTKCAISEFSIDNLAYNENLTSVEAEELLALINEFRDCFAQNTSQLGKTSILKMSIHLSDDTPVVYRPYRLSYNERQVVRDMVSDLLDNGIIRESDSPYASPILLVKKKNGEQRMCVDYRALNAKTIKDRFPLPHVDDFLDKLKGCRYFTSLDLASGYHQIQLEESSIPKTAD